MSQHTLSRIKVKHIAPKVTCVYVCVRACVRALAGEYIKCLDTIPFRRKDVSKRLLG